MRGEKIGTRGFFRPAYIFFKAANVAIIFLPPLFYANNLCRFCLTVHVFCISA